MKNITLSHDTVKQWLEDLEYSDSDKNVIAAIKQALAAPVQEPVARIAELEETVRQLNHALREATEVPTFVGEPVVAAHTAKIKGFDEYGPLLEWSEHWVNFPVGTKFYTTPPAQPAPVQPETDLCGSGAGCLYKVAMIEHLESEVEHLKAAQPAPVQEPVAWIEHHKGGDNLEWENPGGKCTPLYATPPAQRPFVGLTDEEMHACWDSPLTPLGMKHARMIEAKLKEKNT